MNEINQINKLKKEVGILSVNITDSLTALSLDNIFYNILIMKINKISDIKFNYKDQYFPTQFQLVFEMNIFPHAWGSHGKWPGESLWYWENYCSV